MYSKNISICSNSWNGKLTENVGDIKEGLDNLMV